MAIAHVLTWAFLATCFTALIVHYSLTRGKLFLPATYDDVTYLRDGLSKLDGFYRAGFPGLLNRLLVHPPHSPFSTMVAFAGYAIFGVRDWAPYAANGIIIFGLLGFTDYLTRGMRALQKLAAFIFVLSVPIAAQSIYEFRADMAVGLMTAVVVVLLVEQRLILASRRYLLIIGTVLGCALLAKTSVFPITLAICGAAVLAASLRDRLLLGRPASFKALAKAWGTMLLPALLIPLPFYFRNRHEIYFYITVDALGDNSDIWALHASFATHLFYYATGAGARIMMGRHMELLSAVLLMGVAALGYRGNKKQRLRAGYYAFMLAVTFAIPTVDKIKHQFLAVAFDFLFISVAILIVRDLLTARVIPPLRQAAQAGLVGLTIAGLWYAQWPLYWGERYRTDVVLRNAYMRDLYQTVRDRADGRNATVLVGVTGVFANADAFNYMADKDGLDRLKFVGEFTNSNIADFVKEAGRDQFVIVGDPGNSDDNPYTPYSRMLDRTLALLRSRADYQLIATCPCLSGKKYYLFQHLPPSH
jgi:hypothetical protein